MIRDATPADFDAILALNAQSEHFMNALTREDLAGLHAIARYHRVAVAGDRVAGFLLALQEAAPYGYPAYVWFNAHRRRFLYIDRIAVSADARGQGIGSALYRDLIDCAGQLGHDTVTCEIDVDPPNPVSIAFHAKFGFCEIGRIPVAGGRKQVALQERRSQAPAG